MAREKGASVDKCPPDLQLLYRENEIRVRERLVLQREMPPFAVQSLEAVTQHGIPCGAHFIFGLPGESKAMMLNAADIISQLPLTTVKFHQLQIFKGTKMAEEYQAHPETFHLFDLEEYIDFVIDFAERLNPDIVIERFAGEVPPRYLVSEPWMKLRYDEVLSRIEKRMEERDTRQGKKVQV